ncbi:alpha/beta fold hydrolase [Actinomadura miaoliensis]|uniref:alpha/beta fold hydrolase n=1 Tax=Actinomadura miaoliensis TaxID=430685 RepID=UPI003CD05AA9
MLAAGTAGVADADTGEDELGRFYQQRLHWKNCTLGPDDEVGRQLDAAGARCADVTVPLDYARPEGRTIKIAISRLRASDPRHRIGTMILNGGGPGPAIDMPPYMRDLMKEAGPRFDLVGMDPRSIGRSAPVDCGWPASTWIRSSGLDRRSFDRGVAFARDLARRCARAHPDTLPHISTRNIARDMDVVRGALGERKVSYNGGSYGTYLGAVYAAMFPGRLDRVLLDSAVDPERWSPRLIHGTEPANEAALRDWAGWAARRDDTYHLGATQDEVLGTVRRIIESAAERPLPIVGLPGVDDTIVPVTLFDLIDRDRDEGRAEFTDAVVQLKKAAGGTPVEATGALKDDLVFQLRGDESRYGSAQSAIICGDAAAPRDPQVYWRDVRKDLKRHPVFGGLGANTNPCAFWAWAPREPLTEAAVELPALLVGATGDTRTIYRDTVSLHEALNGSRLITLKANVHAPYQSGYGDRCVDDKVNDYLLTGRLPGRDVVCGTGD